MIYISLADFLCKEQGQFKNVTPLYFFVTIQSPSRAC